ncbi:MAG: flagellar hook-associated protein FlgK [Planctomycetes bacterium]|nr:flagellar hook-associated protein FlgK [Planctomycetota bacterium]
MEFSIGVSALQAAQQAMAITGNNVANANTPGYHRQVVKLAAASPMLLGGQSYGRGVEVVDVQRAISQQLEAAITTQGTQNGYVDSLSTSMTQLQSFIATDSSSIANQLGAVFNGLQQASSQLGNSAARVDVVTTAQTLASQFNTLAGNMDQMRTSLDASIVASVNSINPLLKQVADLNAQIASFVDQGVSPNDLLDKRDQLVNTIAQQIPIEVEPGAEQQVTILQSGAPLVIAGDAQQIQYTLDKNGAMNISVRKGSTPLNIDSGALGGMLQARNQDLPDFRQRLDTLAKAIAKQFDSIQSTGVGVNGGFTQLTGQRSVLSTNLLLNSAGLAFPPQAGEITIGLTNTATGQRTMVTVPIDPATQTLKDAASAIGAAVPYVQAFVNDQTGTLSLIAAPGYKFDFTGGVDTNPTTSFSPGTTVTATTGGLPAAGVNDTCTFTFLSSGTVGVTPGLQAQVTDKLGNVLGTVDVGQGYEAGQPVKGPNGVTLTLSAGNVTAGDSLSANSIGNPDSAGLLVALGLNTFFSGNDAASLQVSDQLASNPDCLATSQTGLPGDTSNLQRFVGLQDVQSMGGGTQRLSDFFNKMVSDVGSQVSGLNQQASTNQVLTTRLQDQQQSQSGVDMNEEMVQVIKYQQMFQSAAKYISAVNDMLQQLFQSL